VPYDLRNKKFWISGCSLVGKRERDPADEGEVGRSTKASMRGSGGCFSLEKEKH